MFYMFKTFVSLLSGHASWKDLSGKLEFHGNELSESDTLVELGEIWCRHASTAVEHFMSSVKAGALKATLSGRE